MSGWVARYGNRTRFTEPVPASSLQAQGFFFIDPGLLHAEATGETCEQSNSDCMNVACATSAKALLYSEV